MGFGDYQLYIITPLLLNDQKTLEQQCNSNKKQKPYIIFKESTSRLKPGTFCKFNLKKEVGN